MITAASRLFFGIAVAGLLAGAGYAFGSDFEWYGIVLFLALVGVAATLGVVAIGHRDGTVAPGPDADLAPSVMTTQPSPWPVMGAVGAGLIAVGVAAGVGYLAVGIAVLVVAVLETGVQSWSERLSADPAHNRAERDRVMLPIEIPIGVALVAAFIAISFSRVLLAVSATGAVVAAGVVAVVILAIGTFVALRPNLPRAAFHGLAVFAGVAVLAAGVGGLAAGEREIEHHGAEHGSETDDHSSDDHSSDDADHGDEADGDH